jgi:hypothetical protein
MLRTKAIMLSRLVQLDPIRVWVSLKRKSKVSKMIQKVLSLMLKTLLKKRLRSQTNLLLSLFKLSILL